VRLMLKKVLSAVLIIPMALVIAVFVDDTQAHHNSPMNMPDRALEGIENGGHNEAIERVQDRMEANTYMQRATEQENSGGGDQNGAENGAKQNTRQTKTSAKNQTSISSDNPFLRKMGGN
jgi:hypothetical protein